MRLFPSQKKIPFNSLATHLRAFPPGSPLSAAAWASFQIGPMNIGDMLFFLEAQPSHWSDPDPNLGVGDGDTFRVSSIGMIHKIDVVPYAYIMDNDSYSRRNVQEFLTEKGNASQDSGFYFAIVRPRLPVSQDEANCLALLDEYEESGARHNDGDRPDVAIAFFAALNFGVSTVKGQMPDIIQLGYSLFCDAEPPSGNQVPDLRPLVSPLAYPTQPNEIPIAQDAAEPEVKETAIPAAEEPPVPAVQETIIIETKSPDWELPVPQPPVAEVDVSVPAPDAAPAAKMAFSPPPEVFADMPPPRSGATSASQVEEAYASLSDIALPPAKRYGHPDIDWGSPEDYSSSDSASAEVATPDASAQYIQIQIPEPSVIPPLPTHAPEPPATSQTAGVAHPPPLPQSQPRPGRKGSFTVSGKQASANPPEVIQQPITPPPIPPQPVAPVVQEVVAPQPVATEIPLPEPVAPEPVVPEPIAQEPEAPAEPAATVPTTRVARAASRQAAKVASDGDTAQPDAPRGDLQNRPQLKEQVTVKSGVARYVSLLEQQASKASNNLDAQVDEIQTRLSDQLKALLGKIDSEEKRSAKSAAGLRMNLAGQLDSAAAEIEEKLSSAASTGVKSLNGHVAEGDKQVSEKLDNALTTLRASIEAVRTRAGEIAKEFDARIEEKFSAELQALKEVQKAALSDVGEVQAQQQQSLEAAFKDYSAKLENMQSAISALIERQHVLKKEELSQLKERLISQLDQGDKSATNILAKQFSMAEAAIRKAKEASVQENVVPRLVQHRQELHAITSEFLRKLSQDLEQKGQARLTAFDPVLVEKKQQLLQIWQETEKMKETLEGQLQGNLNSVVEQLKVFVDEGAVAADNAHRTAEEQLVEIDRSVRALADPSSIEHDVQLLDERDLVVAKMDDATKNARSEVLDALRAHLAALEEKGKQLQEELISSMEEDAYHVRRASEKSLVAMREAIRDAFVAIQTAQDERMPM